MLKLAQVLLQTTLLVMIATCLFLIWDVCAQFGATRKERRKNAKKGGLHE
jgi:hypothetical protein